MGFFGFVNDMATRANKPIERVASNINAAKKAQIFSKVGKVASSVAGTGPGGLRTGGAAMRMAATGALGAGAGYAYGDGDKGDIARGAAAGVLGGAAWHMSTNPALRAGIKEGWSAGRGMAEGGWSSAKSKAGMQFKRQLVKERRADPIFMATRGANRAAGRRGPSPDYNAAIFG